MLSVEIFHVFQAKVNNRFLYPTCYLNLKAHDGAANISPYKTKGQVRRHVDNYRIIYRPTVKRDPCTRQYQLYVDPLIIYKMKNMMLIGIP